MSLSKINIPGGGMLLVSAGGERVLQYNAMAHVVWRLQRCGDIDSVIRKLASKFDVNLAVIAADVQALLSSWKTLKTIPPAQKTFDLESAQALQSLSLNIEGYHFRVDGPQVILKRIARLWATKTSNHVSGAKHLVIVPHQGDMATLLVNGVSYIEHATMEEVIGGIHQVILQSFNPESEFAAILHAATVRLDGNSVVLAAPSGKGKSTLTAQLVAAGYAYGADDIVALTKNDFHIAPFPAAMSVKPGSSWLLAKSFPGKINVDAKSEQYLSFGASFAAPHSKAKLLVFPHYVKNSRLLFEPVTIEEAMSRLLNDRIFFGHPLKVDNIRQFVAWLKTIPIRSLVYSDFQSAERCIRQCLT